MSSSDSDKIDPYSNVDIQDYNMVKLFLDRLGTNVDKATDSEYNVALNCRDNYLDPQDDLEEENIIHKHIIESFLNHTIRTLYE